MAGDGRAGAPPPRHQPLRPGPAVPAARRLVVVSISRPYSSARHLLSTASNIAAVRSPVNTFLWLGW